MKLLKNTQDGFAHLVLIAILVVVGMASYGTYQYVSSSANIRLSVRTEDGCWLAGRKWEGKTAQKAANCSTKCRDETAQIKRQSNMDTSYCSGHVWIMGDVQACVNKFHRYYLTDVNGCARKPSQNDGMDSRYCQPGYAYYNADYVNREKNVKTRVDFCEVSKRVATKNEVQGNPGQTPLKVNNPSQTGTPVPTLNSNGNTNNNNGSNNTPSNPVKKVTIRIGSYNAWSVSKTNSSDQVRRLGIGMAKMRENGAEIVALQEFSGSQTTVLKKSSYWSVHRSNMSGNRGLGIAYKKDAFKVISRSEVIIPRDGADQHEPILTLERKQDKARITVMSVHLVAFTYGRKNYEDYQVRQQKAVKDKAISLKNEGKVVVLAGDFNWDFAKRKGYMSPLTHKGIRYTNFLTTTDQKLNNFKEIDAGQASDHRLLFVDAETVGS